MASHTDTLVSVAEYLATNYEPDAEYLGGRIVERNVGQWDHSSLQAALAAYFYSHRGEWQILVATEQRMALASDRFRIPDVCVLRSSNKPEPVLNTPPLLCIEILSPGDRASDMFEKVQEYLDWGVEYVWVIDPARKTGWSYAKTGTLQRAEDGVLTEPFALNLREI
ncbi:MAG TPA: Uma2 family endonuclease [Bryobacteraceae bacterium]|nr:Uma2 family endonuclease [Bryobacteraceae bacterium]